MQKLADEGKEKEAAFHNNLTVDEKLKIKEIKNKVLTDSESNILLFRSIIKLL